jgi:Domain of unknown function (DUF4292)
MNLVTHVSRTTAVYVLILAVLATSACHKPRHKHRSDSVVRDTVLVRPDSVQRDTVVKVEPEPDVREANVDFKYLTAKSKISFKSKDQDIDNANVNIRMKKDSVIWLQINALGIEVARGLITRDSIQFLDRYHKQYYKYTFADLGSKFSFKLDFDLLQSILVGNMPIPKKAGERFKREKDFFMLRQEAGKVVVESYVGEQNRRLKKLLAIDEPTKTTLRLDYDDFSALNNYLFPYTGLVELDYESKEDKQRYQTVFRIKHQKVELTDEVLSFPFSIPAKYERK